MMACAGALQREFSEADQKLLDALESRLRDGGLAPPSHAEIEKDLRAANRFTGFVRVLEAEGRLVRLSDSLLYHPTALADVEARLRTFLASHDVMSMADFKELTGLSRKFAVPLLEYFDRKGVTRRDGDVRRPGEVCPRRWLGRLGEPVRRRHRRAILDLVASLEVLDGGAQ